MDETPPDAESIEDLKRSFFYGSRSDLNVKFLKDLSDAEFGEMLAELFAATSATADDGNADRVTDVMYRWQIHAYSGHLGDPAEFPHRHADVPLAAMRKPLSECRVALLTSSGHFVQGDDPQPLGVGDMTQQEAEERIGEFIRTAPELSEIPVDTPPELLRVRHGGYPVASVAADHQVALPLAHLRSLADDGVIGELAPTAFSFVGATSQGRLKKDVGPAWAQRLTDDAVDTVLLVPV
jgi:D-proline reductase (dithiol) PrdB